MSITNKHLQHLRSRLCEYKQIRKEEIPSGVSIEVKSSIPTSAEILELFKQNIQPAEYIQVSTNNWYYQLEGKAPSTDVLLYGELAVSYQKGYERVFFKNSENELVSLQPLPNTSILTEGENVDIEIIQQEGKITAVNVTDNTNEAIQEAINATLNTMDSSAKGSSDNVTVEVYQLDGLITDVVVTDTCANLINNLTSTAKGTSTNVDVEVKQENGKLTSINITDRTNEAITNAINTLDSTVTSETENDTKNVNVQVVQEDGKLTSINVIDNTNEAINNAIEEAIYKLDSTTEGTNGNVTVKINQVEGIIETIEINDNIEEKIIEKIDESLRSLDADVIGSNNNIEVEVLQVDGKVTKVNVSDKGLSKKLVINNINELTVNENNECIWSIPYTQLQEVGIDPDTAGVFVREIQTGIQLIADIQFNNTDNNLIIKFSSENNIPANTYKTIILS